MTEAEDREPLAAVDLGSNSFHMIVGRFDRGTLTVVDKLRERVRLAAGLDERKRLTGPTRLRALDCLRRFGERLRGMPKGRVRVVGTNTLRRMKDSESFLVEAQHLLGYPVEIISGREEARLFYLGVSQTTVQDGRQQLVVDIGGGSTECIIGVNGTMRAADSLFMGCVSYSMQYFPGDALTESAFADAALAAQLELQPIVRRYRELGWDVALGCSGTVHAVKKIVVANGWTEDGRFGREELDRLTDHMLEAGHVDAIELAGLQEDRRPVIAGGVAILQAVFDAFELQEMLPAPGALREGTLFDLHGRMHHDDLRDRTIRRFQNRHDVDRDQAARVRRVAFDLLDKVAHDWGLDEPEGRRLLGWASDLHEVGLSVAYTGYHKHSAYIVAHSDMPGFSTTIQNRLAAIIQGHRRKLKPGLFEELYYEREETIRLAVLFRMAVALCRRRSDERPAFTAHVDADRLILEFDAQWAQRHPMSMVDLEGHADAVARVGLDVAVRRAA